MPMEHFREPVRVNQPSRIITTNNGYYSDMGLKSRSQPPHHVNVVVTQPGKSVWDFEHSWSSTLCSCTSNCSQCCFAFFCLCCFEYQLYKRAGENICTCLCPCARFALRSKIRTAFRIEGDLCNDCLVSACCPCCASIQLTRELYNQGL